jgi:hypothetical protein
MSNDEPDHIEKLLDEALASYSMQQPEPGLEWRVLERVHLAAAPRVWLPRWAWAIPAAACLLGAGMLWVRHGTKPERMPVAHGAVVRATAPLEPMTSRRVAVRPRKRKALPKLAQFPAPTPLTNGERALLAFAKRAPSEVRASLIEKPEPGIEPIRIDEIKIQPLP